MRKIIKRCQRFTQGAISQSLQTPNGPQTLHLRCTPQHLLSSPTHRDLLHQLLVLSLCNLSAELKVTEEEM